jgi:DNA-binding HxlR family transcriptional regulator
MQHRLWDARDDDAIIYVLRALVTGPARFSDIAAAIPGMTDKLLSRRLKDLEADGLVERRVHAGPPVRIQYRLTEKGDALSTILLDLRPVGAEMDRPTRRSLMRAHP